MSIEREARAEAEKRIPSALLENITDPLPVDWKRKGLREGFVRGYIAGATRPVTDEQIAQARAAARRGALREAAESIERLRALADKETP